jgi:hypothetical protein
MINIYFGHWDYWELRDKVTFDMFRRLIIVNPGVTSIDVKADVYSAWKRWMVIDDNNKIGQVIRVIGGDATVSGQKAGDIYFLVNGWRLLVDLSLTAVIGSIFSDDFDSPLINPDMVLTQQSLVSSLVTGIKSSTGPTALEISAAVWAEAIRTLTSTGLTAQESAHLLSLPTAAEQTTDILDAVL